MIFASCIAFHAMAALISAAPQSPEGLGPVSPCPELFTYDALPSEGNDSGRWAGRLVVQTKEDLRGIWIRLVFDGILKAVTVDDFETIISDDKREVLIKNRHETLLVDSPRILKLNVVYDGQTGSIPKLVEYRLNARTVCPGPNANRSDFFQGDSTDNFLQFLQSHHKPAEPPFSCGQIAAAKLHPHPWAASLHIRHAEQDTYACAAALISPSYVITAAHCVTFMNDSVLIPSSLAEVHLGETHAKVARIVSHPGYQAGYLDNDLAILELSAPVALSESISPICLRAVGEKESDKAVLVGTEIGRNGGLGEKVLEAAASKISEEKCLAMNAQLRGLLDDGSYCLAYGSGNTPCVGNSGSSFISLHGNRATLKGIVTLGVRLQNILECNQNSVVIVADIERYLGWIERVIY